MGYINKLISFFLPHYLLKEQETRAYFISEKEITKLNMLIIFPLMTAVYILHYFYFDRPMGLTAQSDFWFYFRFGMAGSSLLGFALYWFVLDPHRRSYRTFAVLNTMAAVVLQSYATYLYQEAPILYPYVFILVSIFLLRLTVLQNILYSMVAMIASSHILLMTKASPMDIYSAAFVTFIITLLISSRNLTSILLYKSNLEKLMAQKQLIERQIEIVDQLRGFLPKQIFSRFHELSTVHKYSTAAALDDILKPKNKEISCLFSDIRGYTQHSKNTEILESQILPMIRESSTIIEDNNGIPRKIGDLIFSYFDEDSILDNIQNCFRAALVMAVKNNLDAQLIQRSIILTYGSAVVGNIGGAGSAIEITAMGPPSNECARLDEFIKKNSLFSNKIIFSPSFFEKLVIINDLEFQTYKLAESEIVRDFNQIREIHYIDFATAKKILTRKSNRVRAA